MNPPASIVPSRLGIPETFARQVRVLFVTLSTLACPFSRAELLLAEPFSYPNGPLVSAPATMWKNQEGAAAQIEVTGGALLLKDGGMEVVSAGISGGPHVAGTLYAGFSVRFQRPPNGASHFAAFNAEDGRRNLGRLYATTEGAAPGAIRIGISTFRNPLNNTVPTDLFLGREYRIVLRYEPQTLGMTVWVNPSTEESGGVQPNETLSTFPSPISSFVFRQDPDTASGEEALRVDNLAVSTTFAEARDGMPEWSWVYSVQNGAASVSRYVGSNPKVVMPETLGGAPVRSFRPTMFQGSSGGFGGIVDLTLPSGITNISPGEFSFSTLTNITFLGPIRAIPNGAFIFSSRLASVSYPDTVTSIGDEAFANCSRLQDIRLPASLTRIGTAAFAFCTSLKTNGGRITIPASVTTIGDRAFRGCASVEAFEVDPANTAFTSLDGILLNSARSILIVCPPLKSGAVAIPETVTTLRVSAFAGCTKLTGVTLPESIIALPDNAFGGCIGLTSISLPSRLTSLGTQVFTGTGLTEISLPTGVRTIPSNAYDGCQGLRTVIIPEHVTRIEQGAFANCNNLTEIRIPQNVANLGASFVSGARLSAIHVDENNAAYATEEGVLFNKSRATLIAYPQAKPGKYSIPENVRVIGITAFARAPFDSISIPAGVTSIQERAFESCPNLTTLVIPDTVTTLGIAAFQNCTGLIRAQIGRGLSTIVQGAFAGCTRLSEVVIPDTVRSIGDGAFGECPALERIVIPASVRTLGSGVFHLNIPTDENGNRVGIQTVYFEGNAPSAGPQALVFQPYENGPKVFHRAGTTGWESEFAGSPVDLWDPRVAFDSGFGVKNGRMAFTLTGAPGLVLVVEAATDIANPVWTALGTVTLADGKATFQDTDPATHPTRIYRFRSP